MERHLVWGFTLLTLCLPQVGGSGVFQLRLDAFVNSNGTLADGGSCVPDCRTFFKICLKHYQTVVSPGPCTFGSVVTPVLESGAFMDGLPPHISLQFNFTWPKTFSLIVEAFHKPPGANQREVLVSDFVIQQILNVGDAWSSDQKMGRRNTELKYSYRVVCSDHYYGESCSRLCKPRDDRFGHYVCESDGNIACLKGWQGEYCSKRKGTLACNGHQYALGSSYWE